MLNQTSKLSSTEFKKLFLLEFTKELIKNSKTREIFELEKTLEEEKNEEKKKESERKKEISEKIKEKISGNLKVKKKNIYDGKGLKGMIPSIMSSEFQSSIANTNLQKQKPIFRGFMKPNNLPFSRKLLTIKKPQKTILPNKPKTNLQAMSNLRRMIHASPQFLPQRLQYIQPVPTQREIDLGRLNSLIKDPKVKYIECQGAGKRIVVRVPDARQTNIILSKEEINDIIERVSRTTKIPSQEGVFRVAVGKLIFSAIISEVIGSKFIIKKHSIPLPSMRRKMNYNFTK